MTSKLKNTFHLTKNPGLHFQKFPLANGIAFSRISGKEGNLMSYNQMFKISNDKYNSCITVSSPKHMYRLKSFGSSKFDLHFSFVSCEAKEITCTLPRYWLHNVLRINLEYFDDEEYTVETC